MHTATSMVLSLLPILSIALSGCAMQQPNPPAGNRQTHYATPRALVEALVKDCRTNDTAALVAAVGADNRALIDSGDAAADRARCERFVAAAATMTRLDPDGPDRLVLVVGSSDYPLPIPLVKDADGWRLDTAAGAAEILRRVVGDNELHAIAVCRAAARGQAAPATVGGYAFRRLTGSGATLVAYPVQYRRSGVYSFLVASNGTVYQKDLGAETAQAAASLSGTADASWAAVSG